MPEMVLDLRWALSFGSSLRYRLTEDGRGCNIYYVANTVRLGQNTTILADVQGLILESFGKIGKLSWVAIGFMGSVTVVLLLGFLYGSFEVK